jgi:hypothetical protein
VVGINSSGDTVGFYVDGAGVTHSFSRTSGGSYSTQDAPGTAFNQLLGLNDLGESAGYSSTDPTGMTVQRAFTQSGGLFTYLDGLFPIGTLNDQATDVNNTGVVSGFYVTSTLTVGFLIHGTTLTPINFPGSTNTQALGLNNMGQVVGNYVDAGGAMHGFVFDGIQYVSIDLPGSMASTINGINDHGQIVGFFMDANENTIGFEGNPVVVATPEPGTLVLEAMGLLSIGLLCRFKR